MGSLDLTPLLSLVVGAFGGILFVIGAVNIIQHRARRDHKGVFVEMAMTIAGFVFVGLGIAGLTRLGSDVAALLEQITATL